MRALPALAVLLAATAAFGDQTLTAKDGVVWTVREEKGSSGADHESTTLRVLRGDREVARFAAGAAFQSNPTMMLQTSYTFRLDGKGALVATETHVVSRRTDDGKGGGKETTVTTIVERVWNGERFVAGKPKITTSTKAR